jgi:hypothetical protein
MNTLAEFIKDNRPAPRAVGLNELRVAAKAAGLRVEKARYFTGDLRIATSPQPSARDGFFIEVGQNPTVTWTEVMREGVVEYRPYLSAHASCGTEVADMLFAHLEPPVAVVRVPLPERVVTLPAPGWVTATGSDGYPGWADGSQLFISEARAAFEEFSKTAQAVFDEKKDS